MHRDQIKRSAVVRLLVAMAGALALWPAAARADITVFSATAGEPFNGVVAVVTNDCLNTDCRGINPSVNIDWGDGTMPPTRVAAVPDCPPTGPCLGPTLWTIAVPHDPHTYARPGVYAASFTGPIFIGTTHIDAIVGDDPRSINETVPALTPAVGATVSGPVATFTDTNALAQPSEFTATINWGDGQTTAGTVTQPLGQPFQVSGSHVYAHVGSFTVTVAIQHLPLNGTVLGAAASQSVTATVHDATLTGAGNPVTAVAGAPFTGTVATFADPNPFATATDFRAMVTWGSEGTTPGTVVAAPGGFAVTGSHTFIGSGQIPVRVAVSSIGGSSTTIDTVASVSAAPPPPVTIVTLSPAMPDGRHGWFRSGVHATVIARSLAGTVAETRCRLDGAVPSAFGALPSACPFAGGGADIRSDGRHELFAASITSGGQAEVPSATEVAIDRTPPRLACARSAPAFVQGSTGAIVTATVVDATSGPLSRTVSAPAAVASSGRKEARLTGFDQAGNAASIRCAYRVLALLSPQLVFSFDPHGSSTTVNALFSDNVPVAATVRMLCHGAGCPAAARTLKVSTHRACSHRRCGKRHKPGTGSVDLAALFRGRALAPATVVTVEMTERDAIGKAWAFTMRNGRKPKVTISCLAPGSSVPGQGC
jgi:hypothetical protein